MNDHELPGLPLRPSPEPPPSSSMSGFASRSGPSLRDLWPKVRRALVWAFALTVVFIVSAWISMEIFGGMFSGGGSFERLLPFGWIVMREISGRSVGPTASESMLNPRRENSAATRASTPGLFSTSTESV